METLRREKGGRRSKQFGAGHLAVKPAIGDGSRRSGGGAGKQRLRGALWEDIDRLREKRKLTSRASMERGRRGVAFQSPPEESDISEARRSCRLYRLLTVSCLAGRGEWSFRAY